jgi:hypothetical protein
LKKLTIVNNNLPKNGETIGLFYYFYDMHANCPNKVFKKFNTFIENEFEALLEACGFTAIRIT